MYFSAKIPNVVVRSVGELIYERCCFQVYLVFEDETQSTSQKKVVIFLFRTVSAMAQSYGITVVFRVFLETN